MDNYFSTEIAKLLNPPKHSKYLQKQEHALEESYPSRKKYPLGRAPAPTVPQKLIQQGFGVSTIKGATAADLMYPSGNKVQQSIYSETFAFKKPDDFTRPAGVKQDDANNTDEKMKEIFNYNRSSTVILPSSYVNKVNSDIKPLKERIAFDSFEREEPILDEINKVEKTKIAMMDKHFVEVLWHMLKVKNHVNFQDLVSAFKAYKNGNDKITVLDLQNMCQKLGLSAPLHILEKLVEECDIIDKDGALSYEEFIHCLNWKDMIPENYNFKTSRYANDWKEGMKNTSQDVMNIFKTTASSIGDHKYSVCSRVAGQPSYSKVNTSKLKGISEFKEYGSASSMIQPNIFTKYGVFEEDLSNVYTKEEIKLIFMNSGINFNDASFEMVWQNVSNKGKASIGSMWNAMKKQCLLYNKHL